MLQSKLLLDAFAKYLGKKISVILNQTWDSASARVRTITGSETGVVKKPVKYKQDKFQHVFFLVEYAR